VWITEYALRDFGAGKPQASARQQSAFVRTSTTMNRLPYLERYAWFALEHDQAKLGTGLYNAKGRPTPWGQEYRKAR
jgi:predicted NUDIX family NTP pyrophosphohydrolase